MKYIESESEYVMWFSLSGPLIGTDEDVIFGLVYIPPENTKFMPKTKLDMFYAELEEFNNKNKQVILMGDFNARTATLQDIIVVESNRFDCVDTATNDIF